MPLLTCRYYDQVDGDIPSQNVELGIEILSEAIDRMEISPEDLADRLGNFMGEVLFTDD